MYLLYSPTYLISTSLLSSMNVPHFCSSLLRWGCMSCTLLLLCYIISNLKFYSSRIRRMRLFPCLQPELCPRPQRMYFLKLYLNQILFSPKFMVQNWCYWWWYSKVCASSFTKLDTFGYEKYTSYVENMDKFIVRPKTIHLRWGPLTCQGGISREVQDPPLAPHPIYCSHRTPYTSCQSPLKNHDVATHN